MNSPLLELIDISVLRADRVILSIDRLGIEGGRIYSIVGPNGAGKTTLLRLLALLTQPDRGKVLLAGTDVWSDRKTLAAWRKEITLLMQSPYLFSGSVAWNMAYGLRARHLSGRFPSERIMEALRTVGMEHFLNRNVRDLSGGERSRVALARALVLSPQFFLLDEPTAYLDTLWSRRMRDIAQQVRNRNGTTVIFSTQRPEEAKDIADETIYLQGGRLADGQPSNMFIGQVIAGGEVKEIEIEGKLRIYANIEAEGKVIVEIEPEDIILSSEPFRSSARNHFIGTISRLEKADRGIEATLDVGPERIAWKSLLTEQSLKELGFAIGDTIHLTFKASSVRVR